MPYIADENEPKCSRLQSWVICFLLALTLGFLVYMLHITAGSVKPPTHMKSSDPYWYSGE